MQISEELTTRYRLSSIIQSRTVFDWLNGTDFECSFAPDRTLIMLPQLQYLRSATERRQIDVIICKNMHTAS